ncbi:hypothetical protein LSCM1_02863 [Leishmania martiniquensis]|uniref:Sister chromatid cohesion protein DCC1 n=1 Tax=Leishmania martiniquensis TaxID=1580590 RepID=A0A836HJE3_9TRYP|nr:hypothetical protein LSCM1_02863 [Leishmania martiniquensis]
MDHIFIRSNFASRHEYRLLSVEDAWVRQLEEQVYPGPSTNRRLVSRKKARDSSPPAATARGDDFSIAFVMKGGEQLCLHDARSTRSVRRVEYSNSMLLAVRRLNRAGRSAIRESRGRCSAACSVDGTVTASAVSPQLLSNVRQNADDVVVASLSRMFDSHAAQPQVNVVAVLGESYLTIEELEGTAAPTGRGYSFAQLARTFRSSPTELASVLQSIGAVVHRGLVRLLHPSLAYESLTAVLTFLDALEARDASWAAARQHLCPSVYPEVVLRSLEAVYGAPQGISEASQDDGSVTLLGMPGLLNLPRVLLGLAGGVFDAHHDVVFRALGTGEVACGLPLETFTKAWMDAIPSSLFGVAGIPHRCAIGAQQTLMEKLRGYVVVEPLSGGGVGGSVHGTAWWLPKESLSNDFAARLRTLFELRPQRWDQMELKEYLCALVPPDQCFEHVIVRHAREYRIPGQPVQYAPLA